MALFHMFFDITFLVWRVFDKGRSGATSQGVLKLFV